MESTKTFRSARVTALVLTFLASAAFLPPTLAAEMKLTLSGAQEVPPVNTSAAGSGDLSIADDGMVSGSITTTGIEATAAHIHEAPMGKNGGVIVPLVKNGASFSVPPNTKLTDAQMKAFKAGDLYVNVHSDAHKGGEIRAQLK
jgi:CHRD domain